MWPLSLGPLPWRVGRTWPHLPMGVAADQASGVQLQVAGGRWQRGGQKRHELLQGKHLRGIPPQGARQLLAGRQKGSLLLSRHPEIRDRLSSAVHQGRARGGGARGRAAAGSSHRPVRPGPRPGLSGTGSTGKEGGTADRVRGRGGFRVTEGV